MKTISPTLLLLFIAIFIVDFKSPEKLFIPPGTVRVNDKLYFDKAEISNFDWKEYESWNKETYGDSSAQYRNSLPDSLVWRDALTYNDPYVKHYYRHPAYGNYPLVGITYEQAADYCKWRTERVKQRVDMNLYRNKILPVSFNYHLPTESEWEEVAKVGFSEKHQKYIEKKRLKTIQLHNVMADLKSTYIVSGTIKHNNAEITAPTISYFPNKLGIYNLIGNVAEMTSEKGIAMGGSWKDRNRDVSVEKEFTYEGTTAWLGFRCVCDVRWTDRNPQ